ncbi:hypothetical protein Tcan_12031 [Toxocara canis]|uniref:MSP domain-containing protein n=2 Tax=Toxocara canis TaxID=6265 RepID=A0A0B2V1M2_TOXCA|nr:hypothetical protein Tcan_12031 [Toxocara canis]VDM40509.1 unnamed protein product [Toxocara canis]
MVEARTFTNGVLGHSSAPSKAFGWNSHRNEYQPSLRFARLIERPDIAYLQLFLANLSDRPIRFSIKIRRNSTITASPNGTGTLAGHSSTRVLLIWRRPIGIAHWSDVGSAELLLQTEFNDDLPEKQLTIQRMLARVSRRKRCTMSHPPEERFYLDMSNVNSDVMSAQSVTERERGYDAQKLISCLENKYTIATLLFIITTLVVYIVFIRREDESANLET